MKAPRVVALLPMRHGSERVPGKNYRPFAGRPLYQYVLDSLLACERVAEVVIDTDSPEILNGAAKAYPNVRLIQRPPELTGGEVPMNAVIQHAVQLVAADLYLQTHSTNPLLRTATLSLAIERFCQARDTHDSLFSVTRHQKRYWDEAGLPVNHDPQVLLRTQDLAPLYEENSCIYLFTREQIVASGNRIGRRPLLFEIAAIEAWDIDDEADFELAEQLYRAQRQASKP